MEQLNYPQTPYPTNLKGINTNAVSPPNTDSFFNNFFNFPVEFSSNVDAAIIAFFETVTDNKESARALASAVLYTALKQGINPMSILDEFKKLPTGDLNTYTALFLNTERAGTSFLGLKNKPVQNKYVTRAILP
jgi:hypothetical protein